MCLMISTVACNKIWGLTLPCLNNCRDEMKSKINFHFHIFCKKESNFSYSCQNSPHATEQSYNISTWQGTWAGRIILKCHWFHSSWFSAKCLMTWQHLGFKMLLINTISKITYKDEDTNTQKREGKQGTKLSCGTEKSVITEACAFT